MEPHWLVWLRDNMPKEMFAEMESDRRHNYQWRDDLIDRLKAELAAAREQLRLCNIDQCNSDAELAAAREEIKALSVAASALTKEAIEQDAKIAKLRALAGSVKGKISDSTF